MIWPVILVVLQNLVPSSYGHFSVYLSQSEVKKLLGTTSELYYVRDGVVNTYAMNFDVPVSANITQLEFSWYSLIRHPLPYSWTVEYNNRQAMKKPTFNISTQGFLPTKASTFHVKLECTGDVSAEVRVLLNLNVSAVSHRHNDTFLVFRRNKICLKRTDTQIESNDIPSSTDRRKPFNGIGTLNNINGSEPANEIIANNNGTSGRVSVETIPEKSDNLTFYIMLGCFCGLVAIISIFIFNSSFVHSYLGLSKFRLSRDSVQTSYTSAAYAPNPSVFVRLASTKNGSYATISSLHKYSSYVSPYATSYIAPESVYRDSPHSQREEHIYSNPETSSKISYYASFQLINNPVKPILEDPRQQDVNERLLQLNVNRNSVIIQRLVQEGAFGRIYRGLLKQFHNGDKLQNVLIKTVSDEASDQQISTFLSEGLMMFDLKHVNILSVIATNTDLYYPPMLIYPATSIGNLKKYLQNCRVRDGGQYSLHTQDIINMAIQVAVAGVFLHTNGFYHKDLAARNCVVDDGLRVKVTDSALSRDLFPNDYHCLGDNENRPIKWLAMESLIKREYTGASDVWSYGVLIWELMSLGQQPYEEIDPYEMEVYLRNGFRLSQPKNCPDDLFGMMTCCWLGDPEERPTFVQLLACLQDFQTALTRFI
ncbi:tyrosine-protein kinase Dnt-like [Planococcus citri]|uniref:tyrosine-protein kinase Dnt-like n=1 Tax=Planococcus citri TaxID=170843 RepID=UPI0031F909B5